MNMEEKMAQVEAAAAAKVAGAVKADTEMITGHLDVEQLKGMKMTELKALASDMGLKYPFNIKKEDLAAMIAAEPVQAEKVETVDDAVDPETAPDLADALLINPDPDTADTDQDDPNEDDEDLECIELERNLTGRVLVTYTGMVNLRDDALAVVDQAMQGQVFPVTGKCEKNGAVWYRVEDRHGKERQISADVVRYMA
ncbi:MAG: hypothetical protein IJZ39_11455 [Oscillospiraceae bacterium]|nr:hypothetical protein [Oscillospiraceae bacterium]